MKLLTGDMLFDGIVCDLMMPDVTGMDLHAWLVEHQPDLADRMLFITGGAFTPRARQFLASVNNPCFEKPPDTARLMDCLQRLPAREATRS